MLQTSLEQSKPQLPVVCELEVSGVGGWAPAIAEFVIVDGTLPVPGTGLREPTQTL